MVVKGVSRQLLFCPRWLVGCCYTVAIMLVVDGCLDAAWQLLCCSRWLVECCCMVAMMLLVVAKGVNPYELLLKTTVH